MPIDPALLATSIEALGDLEPEPDLPAALQRAVTAAKQLFNADAAGITLTDATGGLHWASGTDQPAQAVENDREACAAGPCAEAFTTGRPAVMYDAYQERRRGGPWGEVSLAIAELEPRSALSDMRQADALASRWGTLGGPEGRVVWFELDLGASRNRERHPVQF